MREWNGEDLSPEIGHDLVDRGTRYWKTEEERGGFR